jgi:hypothetical protein
MKTYGGEPGGPQALAVKEAVTAVDVEAEFLSGGDPRALRWELDQRALVCGPDPEDPPTLRLTPPGRDCC